MRHVALAFALTFAFALAGCIENMSDLKARLGVSDPLPPAAVIAAPIAKAQANATSTLVGIPVAFLSEGTRDPQDLALDYQWNFGDGGLAHAAHATHAFSSAGEYHVRLVVTNAAGLVDEAAVLVKVAPLDRAPSASIRAPARGDAGAPVAFEAVASDPENGALNYAWDFGDGETSAIAAPQHAFAKPGIYSVKLAVTDRAGNTAVALASVPIDDAWSWNGTFAPTAASATSETIPVAAGARSLSVVLSFDAGLGVNDLEVSVVDAKGTEIARTASPSPAPGASLATQKLDVTSFAAPGDWTITVTNARGVNVAWTLNAVEKLS